MSKVKETTRKVKSKIDVIAKISKDPNQAGSNLYDKYLKDLSSTDELLGKKVGDFLDKRTSKKENKNDIFGQLINTASSFINDGGTSVTSEISGTLKLKNHSITAATKTLELGHDIVMNNVNKIFFAGDGICGANNVFTIDNLTVSPKEIDFLSILTINPDNGIGKIIYEDPNLISNKLKFDRELYSQFTGTGYTFESINGNPLFNINWDAGVQKYNVDGLTLNSTISNFITDYYSSIVFPDISHVIKTSMLLSIQGDGNETSSFNLSLDKAERLLQKLLAVCGTPTKRDELKNQTPIDLFDENDEDIEYYFNFDDVEGIDLDKEEERRRGVLKFKDCNNFEIPRNTTMIDDFIYFSLTEKINKLTDDTLNRVATDAFEQSDSSISLDNFKLSLFNDFILNVPKALVSSILTPKIFFPIIVTYKEIYSLTDINIYEFMKKLSKLFFAIIKDIFWKFIREFWKLLKPELIKFISNLVQNILRNMMKRYVTIVTSLISQLTKILQLGIDNCSDLFGTILETINIGLSASMPFTIPGILLGLSDHLPGYSTDRATLNITERMEAAGISLEPIYGESNKLIDLVKSIVDGHTDEEDTNGYVVVSNKEIIIPTPAGVPIIIPPGLLNSAGKHGVGSRKFI